MLSSRYLHLHEALGLGPMWLQQGATVLTTARETSATPPSRHEIPQHSSATRISAMAAMGIHKTQFATETERPSEKTAATPVAVPDISPTPLNQSLIDQIKPAKIMVVSICTAPEDNINGEPISGEAGVLLKNMLSAIGILPEETYKTTWIKSTDFCPTPSAEQIAAALPQLQAELNASQAQAVLFLGQIFEQPQSADIPERLCNGVRHIILPHPARLLRQPQLKAKTWQSLKTLRPLFMPSSNP